MSPGSHYNSEIFLGHKGEPFEEFNSHSVLAALTDHHEKSALLKNLSVDVCAVLHSPSFLQLPIPLIGSGSVGCEVGYFIGAGQYLIETHGLKLLECSWRLPGFESFWIRCRWGSEII